MYTSEHYNGKPIELQNILVTDLAKLMTYIKVETKDTINGCYGVMVNPETFNYSGNTYYSSMDLYFYEYNKMLLEMGLTPNQLNDLDSIVNTRLNNRFKAGQYDGAKWERKCQQDKKLVPYI